MPSRRSQKIGGKPGEHNVPQTHFQRKNSQQSSATVGSSDTKLEVIGWMWQQEDFGDLGESRTSGVMGEEALVWQWV